MMSDSDALAMAALWASIHSLRNLLNSGLVHLIEVDGYEGAFGEGLPQEVFP
jgi:hypothetical protein